MPHPGRRQARARCAAGLVVVLVLAACGAGELTVASRTATPGTAAPDPDPTTGATASPGPTIEPSATPVVAETDRAARVQAAYRADDLLWELDGGPDPVEVGSGIGVGQVTWVGVDRTMLISGSDELRLWRPDTGEIARVDCDSCYEVVAGDDVYAIDRSGVLKVYDVADLRERRVIEHALPETDADSLTGPSPLAQRNGLLYVVLANGPSAYGGPQQIWTVDTTTGASRFVLETGANIGIHLHAVSPGGRLLALGGLGARSGYCSHWESVALLDLDTGELRDMAFMEGDPTVFEGELRVHDLFWSGATLFAAAWRLDRDCETEIGPSLYRYDAERDVWDMVDFGPFERVRPIGDDAGHKIVVVAGKLYYEQGGVSTSIVAGDLWIVGSTPTTFETDLRLPAELGEPWPQIWVEPWGDLAGAHLGDEAEVALGTLIGAFGPPEDDTGWVIGCPLDGAEENERSVRWGSLRVDFVRTEEGESLFAWTYGIDPTTMAARPGGPSFAEVHLPGGVAFGDALAAIGRRLRLPAAPSPIFDGGWVVAPGFELFSASSIDGPLEVAAVPFAPACE